MEETHFKTRKIHGSFMEATWQRWEGCKFEGQPMLQKEFEASLGSSYEDLPPIHLGIKIKSVVDIQSGNAVVSCH